jgi:hypothetical protein
MMAFRVERVDSPEGNTNSRILRVHNCSRGLADLRCS